MFDSLLAKVSLLIVSFATMIAGFFGIASKQDIPVAPQAIVQQQPILGAQIPTIVTRFETSLQSSISSSASSMTLVSGTDSAGTILSGFTCFTLDEGSSVAEDVCGTASSTSVTSMTRGISPTTGTSSVASLQFAHRRGASVKITDAPQLPILSRIINGNETLPNVIRYDASISTSTVAANGTNLVDVALLNTIVLQGAPYATTSSAGLVQFATGAQLGLGTIQASAGIYLVPSAKFFNYTPQAATTVPVTLANGKLAQGFIDLTQDFLFSGRATTATTTILGVLTATNATTTLAATTAKPLVLNGVSYFYPATQGAASSTLMNDGSGNLIAMQPFRYATSTTAQSSTSWGTSATTVAMTLTYTPPVAGRVMVIFEGNAITGTTVGDTCTSSLYVDKTLQLGSGAILNGVTSGQTTEGNVGFTHITTSVSAGAHTFDIAGQGGSHTCTGAPNYMSLIYIGN
jgi:hypothetical protein